MPLFIILILALLLGYALLMTTFALSWSAYKTLKYKETQQFRTKISVLIAFRNEAHNISNLVKSLAQQKYPLHLLEVIFIDDNSTDNSLPYLEEQIKNLSHYKVLSSNLPGKKEALSLGAKQATGELLVFTDADCIHHSEWLASMASAYENNNDPDLIIGTVNYNANYKGILQKFIHLEFISLQLTSIGAAATGTPIMCNGANMAVKKASYLKHNTRPEIASGDDVFMMHSIKQDKGNIVLAKPLSNQVETNAPEQFSNFINQRVRWGAKARFYKDSFTVFLSVFVTLFNITLIILGISACFNFYYAWFLGLFFAKTITDIVLFSSGKKYFFLTLSDILLLMPLNIIYPFYLVSTAFIAIKRPFEWKGRILKV